MGENEVIVYDLVRREFRKDLSGQVKDNKEYQEIKIPRFGKTVDVFQRTGPEGDQIDRHLATVKFDALGFTMNMKRHMGELKTIYVRTGVGCSHMA